MADQEDVRRLVLALPDTIEDEDGFAFSVRTGKKPKGLVWSWKERVDPKKARVPNPEVVAVRVANLQDKEALLATGGEALFTEPHYNGYPAVLVRLPLVSLEMLEELVTDAWRCQAPKALLRAWEQGERAK